MMIPEGQEAFEVEVVPELAQEIHDAAIRYLNDAANNGQALMNVTATFIQVALDIFRKTRLRGDDGKALPPHLKLFVQIADAYIRQAGEQEAAKWKGGSGRGK